MMTDFNEATKALYSAEAERLAIGACLINPDMFPLVSAYLAVEDFHLYRHRWIWRSMGRLSARSEPIDLETVALELGDERLKDTGGRAYLTDLVNNVPSSLHADGYGRRVKAFAHRRAMLEAARNIATAVYRDDLQPEDLAALANQELKNACLTLPMGASRRAGDLAAEYLERIRARAHEMALPGIPTGFAALDLALAGGLQKGELIVVAAFPGGGKTAFLTAVAQHAACRGRVCLHSLEMTADQTINRIMAQISDTDAQMIRSGRLDDQGWKAVTAAADELGQSDLEIAVVVPLSVALLKAHCLRMQSDGGLDLVVVDYAGLMKALGEGEYEQYRALSRDLKLLAKELDVPILVAHQLNRRGREADAPKMQHLRGSGTWEQDADVVLLLHPSGEPARGGLIPHRLVIAKQRNGPTGCIDLLFKPATTEFVGKES